MISFLINIYLNYSLNTFFFFLAPFDNILIVNGLLLIIYFTNNEYNAKTAW